MRVLVTGGAGYVGSEVIAQLHACAIEVSVLDTFQFGESPVLTDLRKPGTRIFRGDVANPADVAAAAADCDAAIHLAAMVGFPACRARPSLARQVIVNGTENVCRAFAGKPIINASTGSVYGDIEFLCSEDSPCNPVSEYGKLKLEAEAYIVAGGGTSLRFATLFGLSKCMRFDLLPNAVAYQAVRNKHFVLYRGSDRRTFLHVNDAARAYVMALHHFAELRYQVFNVGDERLNWTKRKLVKQIAEVYPMHVLDEESLGSDPDLRNYEVSYEKFRKITGFTAAVDFKQAIREVGRFAEIVDCSNRWRVAV